MMPPYHVYPLAHSGQQIMNTCKARGKVEIGECPPPEAKLASDVIPKTALSV